MRIALTILSLLATVTGAVAQHSGSSGTPSADTAVRPGNFEDITEKAGVHFQYQSSHTAKHYLPETMGGGVALFDYDNDGRLDIFFVNGAPIADPTPKSTIPQKAGPKYWNRLFHKKQDGTFEDVTER